MTRRGNTHNNAGARASIREMGFDGGIGQQKGERAPAPRGPRLAARSGAGATVALGADVRPWRTHQTVQAYITRHIRRQQTRAFIGVYAHKPLTPYQCVAAIAPAALAGARRQVPPGAQGRGGCAEVRPTLYSVALPSGNLLQKAGAA